MEFIRGLFFIFCFAFILLCFTTNKKSVTCIQATCPLHNTTCTHHLLESCPSPASWLNILLSQMRKQRLRKVKAFADVYTVSTEPRFQLKPPFHYPIGPRGWKVTSSKVTGPALTTSQEPSQCEEALHLWISGKENTFDDIPVRRCLLGPFRPHPWRLTRPHPLMLGNKQATPAGKDEATQRADSKGPRGQRGIVSHGVWARSEVKKNCPTQVYLTTNAPDAITPSAENG